MQSMMNINWGLQRDFKRLLITVSEKKRERDLSILSCVVTGTECVLIACYWQLNDREMKYDSTFIAADRIPLNTRSLQQSSYHERMHSQSSSSPG